jgi:tetratricopeptide (TPR) repeat protein
MSLLRILFLILLSSPLFAQNAELANSFFRKGEYEKAIMLYEPLLESNPIRQDYFKSLLTCYQQLEKYEEADRLLNQQLENFPNQIYLYVELGYNRQLQGKPEEAEAYYEKSMQFIEQNPSYAFVIGRTFRQNHLLDYALRTYKRGKELNPNLNTEISEAQIYGERGDIDKMFTLYLDLVDKNENYYSTAQRFMGSFVSNDKSDPNNIMLRRQLLKRAQAEPKNSWNILLSWLFMQQGDFDKALVQEKSLYRRNPGNAERIEEIGRLAYDYDDLETSKQAFEFIRSLEQENGLDPDTSLRADIYLLKIENEWIESDDDRERLNAKYLELLGQYGRNLQSLVLQVAYAEFLTYSYDAPDQAIEILRSALELNPPKPERGMLEITIADIQVFSGEFNQALVMYSKIQYDFKNSPLAQEARFKVARTSYFKGDFTWAQNQLKVLKSSTSQLIANDAMKLSLKISNNFDKDSLNEGLRLFAKTELLEFQRKYETALDTLSLVLDQHKGRAIEDDALLKQGALLTRLGDYRGAENSLLNLLSTYPESLLIDECLFSLGELYEDHLGEIEKAKEMYERIIFEYPSSIYLVEARKAFRRLRGDDL